MRSLLALACLVLLLLAIFAVAAAFGARGSTPVARFTYSPSAPAVGQVVTFDGSSSTCPTAPCTYVWSDDGPDGPGGTNWPIGSGQTLTFTFQPPPLMVYARLTVTDASGQTATTEHTIDVAAASSSRPGNSPPGNTVPPAVTGTAQQGETLATDNGTWTQSPTTYSYQWQDDGSTDIAGATNARYTATASDVGHTLDVVVTATNAGGSATATSARTATVTSSGGGKVCTTTLSTLTNVNASLTPGAVVCLAAGTYVAPTLDAQPSSTATIQPAPGASVTLTGTTYIFGDHITLSGLRTGAVVIGNYDQTRGRNNPDFIELLNLTGLDFEIGSATNVTVEGGSWGPTSSCGGPYGGGNNSIREPEITPTNILIDNTVIHDVQSYNLINCHTEGLAIFAGSGVTVSNSKFYGNSVYDILIQANSGGSPDNVTLKNNWFAAAEDNSGANGEPVGHHNGIAVGSEIAANLTLWGNHFNDAVNINDAGDISRYINVNVLYNFGMMAYNNYPCGALLVGVLWTQNVWQNAACGASDVDLNGVAMPYVNASNDRTLDYTLTGKFAGS